MTFTSPVDAQVLYCLFDAIYLYPTQRLTTSPNMEDINAYALLCAVMRDYTDATARLAQTINTDSTNRNCIGKNGACHCMLLRISIFEARIEY